MCICVTSLLEVNNSKVSIETPSQSLTITTGQATYCIEHISVFNKNPTKPYIDHQGFSTIKMCIVNQSETNQSIMWRNLFLPVGIIPIYLKTKKEF